MRRVWLDVTASDGPTMAVSSVVPALALVVAGMIRVSHARRYMYMYM